MASQVENLLRNLVSDEQLAAEVERRKRQPKPEPTPAPPVLKKPDFSQLIKTITDGTAETIKNGYEDDDLAHYIYEAAVEAVYGKHYWDWYNAQPWSQ